MAYDIRNDYPVWLTEIGNRPPDNLIIFVDTNFNKHDFRQNTTRTPTLSEVKQWLEEEDIEYRITFHPNEILNEDGFRMVGFWFRTEHDAIRYIIRWKGIA